MEIERTKVMPAPAPQVFGVVADVERMPDWLPTTEAVTEQGPNRLRVTGERGGGRYDSVGLWRAQPEQLRVEWGSEGSGEYAGWLQVHDRADDRSEVTLHLSFLDELEQRYTGERGAAVEAEVDEALDRLAAAFTG